MIYTTKKMLTASWKDEGFSLIEVMVVAGIMAAASLATVALFQNQLRGQKTIEAGEDVIEMMRVAKANLRNKASCEATFGGLTYSPTSGGSNLDVGQLIAADGSTPVLSEGQEFGPPANLTIIKKMSLYGTSNIINTFPDPSGAFNIQVLSADFQVAFENQGSGYVPNKFRTVPGIYVMRRSDNNQIISCYADEDFYVDAACEALGGAINPSGLCDNIDIPTGTIHNFTAERIFVDPAGPMGLGGHLTVGGNSSVEGSSTVTGPLSVGGDTTLSGTAQISGATSINSTLGVTDVATFNSNIIVWQNASVIGNLSVTGNTSLNTLTAAGTATFNGPVILNSSLTLNGTLTTDQLTVLGSSTFFGPISGGSGSPLSVGSNVAIAGDLSVQDITATTVTTPSDVRLKKNISPLAGNDSEKASELLNRLMSLQGYSYVYTFEERQERLGLLAQEVKEVFPQLVQAKILEDGKEYLTVDYQGLLPILIEGMREMQRQNELKFQRLDERLRALESKQ